MMTTGEKVDMDFVTEVLRSYGFEYVDYVYEPGQYAVRGSNIDVFSFSIEFPFPYRLFGDEESQLSKGFKLCDGFSAAGYLAGDA